MDMIVAVSRVTEKCLTLACDKQLGMNPLFTRMPFKYPRHICLWRVVTEYTADELVDNSDDEKCLEKAERRQRGRQD